jgi:hypothetical protein
MTSTTSLPDSSIKISRRARTASTSRWILALIIQLGYSKGDRSLRFDIPGLEALRRQLASLTLGARHQARIEPVEGGSLQWCRLRCHELWQHYILRRSRGVII